MYLILKFCYKLYFLARKSAPKPETPAHILNEEVSFNTCIFD